MIRLARGATIAALALLGTTAVAAAQDTCPNRGQLDTLYCDADNDLVADTPRDPARQKDPSALIFAYSPTENPAVYQHVYGPLMDHLGKCTGKRMVYFPVQSNTAQVEAFRAGRLHIALLATGAVGFAVNLAGAVPFVVVGSERGPAGYQLYAIVKSDSPYKTLSDLKGRKVAHVSPSSNSGNLAPRVMFPENGLKPDEDYKPLMSGGHDKSIIGVSLGDYDMAPVASDIFDRMTARGQVKTEQFRILWKSDVFPTSSYSMAHDLKPELQTKIKACFLNFAFTEEIKKEYQGEDRFLPMTYKDTWRPIREVAEKSGTPYNRAAYDAVAKREADAAAQRAQQQQQQQQQTPPKQ
jgi:phosphonate transport system substrate-binding protein